MIAGWIALAGVLQAALNFDTRVAASTKQHALYAFFLCDIYWLPLMWLFQDVIHYNHIVGSIFTIFLRLTFVLRGPSACFVEIEEEDRKKKA